MTSTPETGENHDLAQVEKKLLVSVMFIQMSDLNFHVDRSVTERWIDRRLTCHAPIITKDNFLSPGRCAVSSEYHGKD